MNETETVTGCIFCALELWPDKDGWHRSASGRIPPVWCFNRGEIADERPLVQAVQKTATIIPFPVKR